MNVRNIAAYFKERFPPVNMMLFAILFLTVHAVATYFSQDETNPTAKIIIGIIAAISFFFRLRVFDEIKDYQIDVINHSQRVLQSGKVTIQQLIIISALLSMVEIGWSIWCGTATLFCWILAVGYSILMRYEFFIGYFLKTRLFVYASTHMLVMPLIILWIWSAFYKGELHHKAFYLLAALSLFGGFSFEIARKIHSPSAEKTTVDSYSKSLGFVQSIVGVLLFLLAGILVQTYFLGQINARFWAYLLIYFLYASTVVIYFINIKNPLETRLRLAELFVSLFMLFGYVSIIVEIHCKQ